MITEKRIEEIVEEANLREFVNLSRRYARIDRLAEPERKRQLLKTYFPGRFEERGEQPIDRYKDNQVCTIFERVYSTYKSKYK